MQWNRMAKGTQALTYGSLAGHGVRNKHRTERAKPTASAVQKKCLCPKHPSKLLDGVWRGDTQTELRLTPANAAPAPRVL